MLPGCVRYPAPRQTRFSGMPPQTYLCVNRIPLGMFLLLSDLKQRVLRKFLAVTTQRMREHVAIVCLRASKTSRLGARRSDVHLLIDHVAYSLPAAPEKPRGLSVADVPQADFRGVRGCTSTSRAFLVQVDYFRVTDSPLDCQW